MPLSCVVQKATGDVEDVYLRQWNVHLPFNCLLETEQGNTRLRRNEFLNAILSVSLINLLQILMSWVHPTLRRQFKVGNKISLISIWLKNKGIQVDVSKTYVCISPHDSFRNSQSIDGNTEQVKLCVSLFRFILVGSLFHCGMLIVFCVHSGINLSFDSLLRNARGYFRRVFIWNQRDFDYKQMCVFRNK